MKVYTTFEISRFCAVDISTVMGWVDDGKLHAYRTPGGHRRVNHDDLLDFLAKYRMPIHPLLRKSAARVLIVEDDAVAARIFKRFFQKEVPGAEIDVAYNGFEAGRKLTLFEPDLIVLDLMLPGVDGFQVCKNIRADDRNKNTKILAISGMAGEDTRRKILSIGADGFLAKPIDMDEMSEVVRGLIKTEQRAMERIQRRTAARS